MSIKKEAISSFIWVFIQQFNSQIISFFVSITLARLLMPEEFGIFAILSVVIGVGNVLIEGGMNSSLIRSINLDISDYSTVFWFNLFTSIFIYVIVFFLSKPIAFFFDISILESITKWYALTFVINAFSSIQLIRLQKMLMFKKEMIIHIPSLILSSLVAIVLAYNGYGVWALIISALVKSSILAIQLWFFNDFKPKFIFEKDKFKYHFNYGYKLTLSGLIDTIVSNVYPLVIGKFFTISQVGFFDRANNLKNLPVLNISSVINKVTFPLFAKVQDDDVRLKSIYKRIMQMIIFILAPTLLLMAALGEPLFRFIFTEKWLPAVPYFQILCWSGILYPIHAYNLNILKIKGRSELFLKLEIIKKTMLIFVMAISIRYGIYGLLYGGIITSVIGFFINAYYSGKFINYTAWHQIKDLFPTILLATMVSAIIYFMDYWLSLQFFSDILRLLLGSITGAILFFLLSFLLKINALNELTNIIKKQ